MDAIDLRSDTVTKPSQAMRAAMARAEVGDDQYGEDPSVNLLQDRIAALLGKEAALFVPSGTMANQIALRLLTRPGDEVVAGAEAHIVWHEAGASSANAGVQFMVAGQGGTLTAEDFRTAYKPPGHFVFPPTTLVAIENTHNRGGGVVFPQDDIAAVCAAARALGVGDLSGRGAALQCGSGKRTDARRVGGAFRRGLRRAVEGAGLSGRQPHRRDGRGDAERRPHAADARRRDAPIRHSCGGRPLCAGPGPVSSRRRPRERAHDRGAYRPDGGRRSIWRPCRRTS